MREETEVRFAGPGGCDGAIWPSAARSGSSEMSFGSERFNPRQAPAAGAKRSQALATLYQAVRLYVNHFQPSFKLREKEKIAAKVRRYYEKPMTPCERLLGHPAVPDDIKKSLELQGRSVDPVALLHRIRQQQEVLAALACRDTSASGPARSRKPD
jgi:hypothetical protein